MDTYLRLGGDDLWKEYLGCVKLLSFRNKSMQTQI